jgi:hypothetical protein
LALGQFNQYAYVTDPNLFVDVFGLNIFSAIDWTAPSTGTGYNDKVYQQDID